MTVRIDPELRNSLVGEEGLSLATIAEIEASALHFHEEATAPDVERDPASVDGKQRLMDQLSLYRRTLVLRVDDCYQSAIRALNDRNLLGFALAVRALMETAAMAAHHTPKISEVATKDTFSTVELGAALKEAAMASRYDWERFISSPEKRAESLADYEKQGLELKVASPAVSVLTALNKMIKSLTGRLPMARGLVARDYAFLSDICHPSAGGSLIYARPVEGVASLERPSVAVQRGLASIFLPTIAYSLFVAREGVDSLDAVASKLERMVVAPKPPPA